MRKLFGFVIVLSLIILHPSLSAANGSATCTASCGGGITVSCSTWGTCSAVNRSCPNQQGSVTCGATTTSCPQACPDCSSYNSGSCFYTWDAVRQCCVAPSVSGGVQCPDTCH